MASKINKGEILAKFFDDGEYTALFADGAVSAACGYAAGQQAYAVYQNGEAVTVKDVEKNIKVLEMAAQTGCPVVTFYNSVGAKLAEGLDVLTASAKLNAQIAKVSGVIPQVAVVLGVCGGTSALSAANADVCIMAEGAELFFTAPFTAAAKGDKVADAGSAAAAAKAGVAAIVAANAEEAAEKAAHIVGLLPANNLTGPAIFEFEQPAAALTAGAEPAKAADDLRILSRDTRNAYGAEAKYRLAQLYFDAGQTDAAEKELLEYIDASTPHAYWLARSFVLLSDVYAKLGRTLEARQYLLSLRQNYQADDDIAPMIESRLEKLN